MMLAASAKRAEAWNSPSALMTLTPFALGLGLPRHRALHVLRKVDVLHLDRNDLDAHGSVCSSKIACKRWFTLSRSERR